MSCNISSLASPGELVLVLQERIEDPDEDELEDEPLALRLAAGLFTVQQAALIVANLWQMGDPGMQKEAAAAAASTGSLATLPADCPTAIMHVATNCIHKGGAHPAKLQCLPWSE